MGSQTSHDFEICTHSYDARIVKPDKLFKSKKRHTLDIVTNDGRFRTININNKHEFYKELTQFDNKHPDYCGRRGMQFTTFRFKKWNETSHTYTLGSMRTGGYSNYAMK